MLLLLGLIAGAFVLVASTGKLSSDRVRDWMDGFGVAGPLVFIAVSAALTPALFPGPLLAGASGLLFGTWLGTPISIVSATLADKSPRTLAWMIGPAVLVCAWTGAVGASMARMPGADVAGRYLWLCAVVELLSNAGPPWVMALTGNAGEVALLAGFVLAEREITFNNNFGP